MRITAGMALSFWLGLFGYGWSQTASNPVVVELYTSQGCSSCPPADEIFNELANRSDVIPLALHVDYWDYLGWTDDFANPAFTKRQKAYARAAGARSIYTPQMVVGGMEHLVGVQPMELADLIREYSGRKSPVTLILTRDGHRVKISATATSPFAGDVVIQLVRFQPEATVSIERGENAGRKMTYTNIVRSWAPLGAWNGKAPFEGEADIPGDARTAVIVQQAGPGPILAAAVLR